MAEKEEKMPSINIDGYIEDVRMTNADNGVIISYCERTKRKGKGVYDGGYDYSSKQEVFGVDEEGEGEDEEFQEAFDRYKELFLMARKQAKSRVSN